MKKIIVLALALVMTLSLPVIAQAEDVSYTDVVLVDYNFDDATTSLGYGGNDANVVSEYFDETYGNVMDGNSTFQLYSGANEIYTSVIVFEGDFYIPESAMSGFVFPAYFSHKSGDAYKLISLKNGIMKIGYNLEVASTTAFAPGWIHLSFVLDMNDYTLSASITDSADAVIDLTAELPVTYDGGTHRFNRHLKIAAPGADVKVDNIKLAHRVPNSQMTFDILADGTSVGDIANIPCEDVEIKLTFSEGMDRTTIVADNFTLTDDVLGTEVALNVSSYDAVEKTVILTPASALRNKTSYTLTATDLKTPAGGSAYILDDGEELPTTISFATELPALAITAVSDKTVSAGVASYTVTIQNLESDHGYLVASSRADVASDAVASVKKLVDVKFVPVNAESNTYEISVNDGDVSFYLLTDDGNYKTIDIWSE